MGAECTRMCQLSTGEVSLEPTETIMTFGLPSSSYADSEHPIVATSSMSPKKGFYGPSKNGPGGSADNHLPALWTPLYKVPHLSPRETPRFEEMSARSHGEGGDFQTPRPSEMNSTRGDGMHDAAEDIEIEYDGEKMDGMKHGVGLLRSKGMMYTGQFKEDQKHGLGVMSWDDGRRYRGQFEDDSFHGNATMTWPDGREYSGQYSIGKKHGSGCFSWPDGRKYNGQWIVGKRHGTGVYTNAKGFTCKSLWQMDRPVRWETNDSQILTDPLGTSDLTKKDVLEGTSAQIESFQV